MIDIAALAERWGYSDCQFQRLIRAHADILRPHIILERGVASYITATGVAILGKLTGHTLTDA